MRVNHENETEGLDISVHGGRAYDNNYVLNLRYK